jgi:hypothetical protein
MRASILTLYGSTPAHGRLAAWSARIAERPSIAASWPV